MEEENPIATKLQWKTLCIATKLQWNCDKITVALCCV